MHHTPVTVLGLGAMGRALATAFTAAGHPTTVWNRTTGRASGLADVRVAPTPRDAVAASGLVVVCLLDDAAVSATLPEARDALAGRTIVDLTNTTPAQARARSAWVAGHGGAALDGGIMAVPPVIGTDDAVLLVSGDRATFETARPALSALGRARHVGDEPGVASLHDVALLSAMYGLFGGALHAFGLLRAAGGSATGLMPLLRPWLEIMLASLDGTAEAIDSDAHPSAGADSPLAMQARGFDNLRTTAREQGIRDDLLAGIDTLLQEAVASGHGDRDIDALVDLLPSRRVERAGASPGTGDR